MRALVDKYIGEVLALNVSHHIGFGMMRECLTQAACGTLLPRNNVLLQVLGALHQP